MARIKGFSFSEGNHKMGRVGSFSVMPGITCAHCEECYKDCYSRKMIAYRKTVRQAYEDNTKALMIDHRYDEFVKAACMFIDYNEYKLFRLNVSGDFFSFDYLNACCEIAKRNPDVKFLAFTKQYEIVGEALELGLIPSNFNIVFSAWNELIPENKDSVPVAYYDDGEHEDLIDPKATVCDGNCQKCKKCFYLGKGESVRFSKH